MKKTVSGILFVLLLASIFIGAFNVQSVKVKASSSGETVQATDTDWWPMFHHDLSHTGTSTSAGPTTNNTLWSYKTGSYVFSSPAVVGGLVYVGSTDGKVYCLNAATGAQVWNYTTDSYVEWSSPAVVGGFVYVGSHDGKVYCLDATTGKQVWNYTTGGVVESSPAVAGGFVYVGSDDNSVYCLNAATGASVWNYTTGNSAFSSPAVAGGLVFVGSYDVKVYCLNAATGKQVWNYTTGDSVISSPAVVGGLVYVGSYDGNVYCLNAATGKQVWNYTTGGVVESSPAVVGGLVYVGSYDGNVYCLNAATGKQVWNYTTGGGVVSSPAVVGDLVYVGSTDGHVYCLNATTRKQVWSYQTGSYVDSSPAVVNEVVYMGSYNGKVYAFGASDTLTLRGENVAVTPASGVSLTFTNVTSDGITTVTETPSGPLPPIGFKLEGRFYDVKTTAGYSGSITIKIAYDPSNMTQQEQQSLTLWHWNDTTNQWMNITTQVDTTNHVIYGKTNSFSMFAITSTGGSCGVTGYKLVLKETMSNSLSSPMTINYYWSFSVDKWNGAQWVATGINGSSATVVGYVIPSLTTLDLPYYVYVLPLSGSNAVGWGDWFRINYAFNCMYSSTNYSTDYVAELNVHPGDIGGSVTVTWPYFASDGYTDIKDISVITSHWHQFLPPAGNPYPGSTYPIDGPNSDPGAMLRRADINNDGYVDIRDLSLVTIHWHQQWTNTPPPG